MPSAGEDSEVLEDPRVLQAHAFWGHEGAKSILGANHPWRQEDRFRGSLAGFARSLLSTSGGIVGSAPQASWRAATVSRFVSTAISGDVPGFVESLKAIDWPGAWPELFREVTRIGFVHPNVRMAFRDVWRGVESQASGSSILAERMGWSLTKAFDGQLDLMADGLRLLMPEAPATPPVYALYRGQSLVEHETGV